MKAYLFTSALVALSISGAWSQDVTTVTATNYDISDNLDLTAVASIFGESKDLVDFEYRLNNPKTQISNLDLNRDGKVDYLRVIETVEENTHLIVLQSVLGKDLYQDVATIEVEKDPRSKTIQVQVVGDVFLYGYNYIYEPVYYVRPVIFNTFWSRGYVAYYSPWYWGYYPTYFHYWTPCPIFRYRNHIHTYVNVYNTYNYVTVRKSTRAIAIHNRTRANYYEKQNPDRAFIRRNEGLTNSYVMNQTRNNNVTRSSALISNTEGLTRSNTVGNSLTREEAKGNVNISNNSTPSLNSRATNLTRNNSIGTVNTSTKNSIKNSSDFKGSSDITKGTSVQNRGSITKNSNNNSDRSSSILRNSSTNSVRNNSIGNTNSRSSASINTTSTRSSSSSRF